ncbi:membrane protein insertase YidC [Streptomyces sp. NPDC096012]|uniref:YidC/Oxa1 family membrane protein insertase n=1 Tax=Streptomyces sp. NPDC096012 TaxID=3155684 RepID=UPI00336ACA89
MSVFAVFARLVEQLADLLTPLFHGSATAAAIVLFTALVRLLLHPLSRAAARGQQARTALRPRIAALRARYTGEPERLRRAVLELHAEERVSPLSGILPGLLQLPAFFLLYHLFSSSTVGGTGNALLGHRLLAAPLGGRWADALAGGGVFGPAGLVHLGLFAVVAAVAAFNYRRAKAQMAQSPISAEAAEAERLPGLGTVNRVMPFLSFLTLVSVAVVPLAAALYIVTSTTWSAVERAALYR